MGWTVWVLRRWCSPALGEGTAGPRAYPVAKAIPLYRDPYCGTYIIAAGSTRARYPSPEISFPFGQAGQNQHFCSAECRDRYQRLERRAARA